MPRLFEKLRKQIGKGITAPATESNEEFKNSQVRSQIGDLEAERRNRLPDLGSMVYGMVSNGTLDQEHLQEECRRIASIKEAIQENQKQIGAIQLKKQGVTCYGEM